MSYTADNAVIMAAGTSSRFAPLSFEKPKALTEVRGEILIERQIRQLKEAGIGEIIVVTGVKGEQFEYLREKYGVELLENREALYRNNHSSIWAVRERLGNTYICSSDNYFAVNPFEKEVDAPYYAAVYSEGPTREWCLTEDGEGYIDSVTIGGSGAWYMLGHAFWDRTFSRRFTEILEKIYDLPETAGLLWEAVYMRHLDRLKLRLRRYPAGVIFEFDTLDELRVFDPSYVEDTRSAILKDVAGRLGVRESDITGISPCKSASNAADGFMFYALDRQYVYDYGTGTVRERKEGSDHGHYHR